MADRSVRLPLSIAIAILLVLTAEAGVRASADELGQPLVWNDYEAQNKAERMAQLETRGVDVVFIGSSSMNAAADPRLAGRPAYNAALNGADMRSMEFWLEHVVLTRLKPKVVVIGTTSLELNDNGITQRDFYRRLITSDAARELRGKLGRLDRVESWLEDVSWIARYRTQLRRPATIVDGDPRARAGEVDPTGLLRALHAFHARPYAISAEFRRRTKEDSYNDFAVGGAQLAALRRMVDKLEQRGVRPVIVKMPVTSDLMPLHPNGARDYERFERALSRFSPIDAVPRLHDRHFFVDPVHLNAAGMRRFTELLRSRAISDLQ